MRILLTLSLILLFQNGFGQITYIKESKGGSKATDLIAGLPEVINADNYVKRVTKGKRHLFNYLASEPTKDMPYYWVKVVEDNGVARHAHFHFYVQPKTYKIFYLDILTDKMIPEKQCRKKLLADYPIK